MNVNNRVRSRLFSLLLIYLLFCTANIFAAWEPIYGGRGNFTTDSAFHLLYGGAGTSIRGDFTATGNSILKSNNPNNASLMNDTTTFKIDDNTFNNNIYSLGDNEKMNSSSATITLPSYVKGSDIIWAGLFWQGHIYRQHGSYNDNQVDLSSADWNKVTIKDANGTMHQIEAPIGNDNLTHKAFHHTIRGNGSDKGFRHHYGAYHDITNIVKNSYSSTNNIFTVGNIKTTAGKDNGGYTYITQAPTFSGSFRFGLYGGWSMIVVYNVDSTVSDQNNVPLKTVSIYDGFDLFLTWGNGRVPFETTIDISGFYTPKSGEVHSKLLLFAGAGDRSIEDDTLQIQNKTIVNDYIDLNNAPNEVKKQFNHTYTNFGQHMTPGDTNKQGMDLDIYDISDQIGNQQTSTKIKFGVVKNGSGTDGNCDQLFPQVIGFSTELYEPRVCYFLDTIKDDDNNTIFEDKKFIAELEGNKNYKFNMWISNMKASSSDTFLETADLVSIYMNTTNVNYKANSTHMQNINEAVKSIVTDVPNDDKGEYDDNKSTWRIGAGANSVVGGTIVPANNINDDSKKVFIDFETKLNIEDNASNINLLDFFQFKASLKTDSITISPANAQIISQCRDLNTTGAVARPPIGGFNIVNETFSNTKMQDNYEHSSNALYTQVAGQPFNVKVLSLDATDTTNPINIIPFNYGNISLSIIKTPDYSSCAETDTACKQLICDSKMPINGMPIINNIDFDTIDINDGSHNGIISQSYTPNQAHENVSFKVTFTNNLNQTANACSLDNFAIRPATYNFDMNSTQLTGGKQYQLDTNATANGSTSNLSKYTHATSTATLKSSLIIPPGCTGVADDNSSIAVTFNNGANIAYIQTNNIGDYNISTEDKDWTLVDKAKPYGNDCDTTDNNRNTHGANKKVGCDAIGSSVFSFTPKQFKNTLILQNFNTTTFTYIAGDDINMSANLNISATAILEDDTVATSYTSGCYAKDINSTITLTSNPAAGQWLTNGSTAINRIVFLDDNTTTSLENNATGTATLSSSEGNFTNGITNIVAHFNFTRNIDSPDEPFNITRNDFNLSVIDANNVTGNGYSPTANSITKFYYGRSHAPDQRFDVNPAIASINYEVYCDACNKATIGINNYQESSDSINWYIINNDHNTNQQGIFNRAALTTSDGTLINASNLKSTTLQAPKVPHKDKIMLNSDKWLTYNPTDFLVEFYQAGANWAGEGKLGNTVDTNVSTRQNRRLDW